MASSTSPKGVRLLYESLVHDPNEGPLPAYLLLLAIVAGICDAVSFLLLGRVFVANMTGNVVVLGLGIAQVPGVSLTNSVVAILAFGFGAFLLGNLVYRRATTRSHYLFNVVVVGFATVVLSTIVSIAGPHHLTSTQEVIITVLLAGGMGSQSAVQQRLGIRDISTTYLTGIFTQLASNIGHAPPKVTLRRSMSIATRIAGGALGAALIFWTNYLWAFGVMILIYLVILVASARNVRRHASWHQFPKRAATEG